MEDAVEKCKVCKGEGIVTVTEAEPLALCGACKGLGLQAAAAFAIPRAPISLADTLPPVKSCKCGLAFDESAWRALPLTGTMSDGDGGELELRNCHCGSTIAIEIVPHLAPPAPSDPRPNSPEDLGYPGRA